MWTWCCAEAGSHETIEVLSEKVATSASVQPVKVLHGEAGASASLDSSQNLTSGVVKFNTSCSLESEIWENSTADTLPLGSSSEGDGTFKATLFRKKVSDEWGLNLETIAKSAAVISAVNILGGNSVVAAYNAKVHDDRRIVFGDIILSANGISGAERIETIFKECRRVDLVLVRPTTFTVAVPKRGKPIGLSLQHHHEDDGRFLFVSEVSDEDSSVKACNADIRIGDLIIEVDNQPGRSKELLERLRASDSPSFTILRINEDALAAPMRMKSSRSS